MHQGRVQVSGLIEGCNVNQETMHSLTNAQSYKVINIFLKTRVYTDFWHLYS